MTRSTLGELEELILLTLLHLGGEGYAVGVAEEVQKRTGRTVSATTAYMVLRRLEDRAFVTSRMGEPRPERGGRPRRYFAICASALPLLRESRAVRVALWEGLDPIVGSAS